MDLVSAVQDRQIITFTYDGLERVVQPATYGQTTTGKSSLRACLIEGSSRRNSLPCWELYSEAKMVDVAATGEVFSAFALHGYTKGDSAFVVILAEH